MEGLDQNILKCFDGPTEYLWQDLKIHQTQLSYCKEECAQNSVSRGAVLVETGTM